MIISLWEQALPAVCWLAAYRKIPPILCCCWRQEAKETIKRAFRAHIPPCTVLPWIGLSGQHHSHRYTTAGCSFPAEKYWVVVALPTPWPMCGGILVIMTSGLQQ